MALGQQQDGRSAVASLADRALHGIPFGDILHDATQLLAEALAADLVMVLRMAADGVSVQVDESAGGTGETLRSDASAAWTSQVRHTIGAGVPVTIGDRAGETRFDASPVLRTHGMTSGISAVINIGDGAWGVVTADTRLARTFEVGDVELLRDVAHALGTAVAVDRVQRLTERMRRSHDRQVELAAEIRRVTEALGAAATVEAVARAFIEHARSVLDAVGGGVMLLDEDGEARLVALVGYPKSQWPEGPFPVFGGLPHGDAILSDGPVLLETREEYAQRYPDMAARSTSQAAAFLPIHAGGAPIGMVGWGFAEPRRFWPEDLDLMQRLGDQAGSALERARRHGIDRLADAAHEQEMEAIALLAGGIAHRFNNLLGVILNFATLIERSAPAGETAHEDALEIRRAAEQAVTLTRRLMIFRHEDNAADEGLEAPPHS